MKKNIKLLFKKYGLSFYMLCFSYFLISTINPFFSVTITWLINLGLLLLIVYFIKKYGIKRLNKNQRQETELVMTFVMFICGFLVILDSAQNPLFIYAINIILMAGLYLLFTIIFDQQINK